jgi:hypothetical protein
VIIILFFLLLLTPILASLAISPNAANAATTLTFGNTSVGSSTNYISTYKDSSKYNLSNPAIIQSITVYFATSRFSAKTAIYSDVNGAPGILLCQSGSQYIRSAGWTKFYLSQKTLSAGTYWLVVITNDRGAQGRISYSGVGVSHVEKKTGVQYSSEFTNSFGTTSSSDAGSASIYASYIPTSNPSPTPTLTPSPTPTPTPEPTPSPTPKPTTTPTSTPSPISTPSATATPKPSATSTPTPTPSSSPAPTTQIGTYSDAGCTTKYASINWGQLTPGTTKTITLYVRNEGSQPATLSKALTNLNPANLSNYLTLNWNYVTQTINPSAVFTLTLSLKVAANATTINNFSFDTIITATSTS